MSDPDPALGAPALVRHRPPPWFWVTIFVSVVVGIAGQVVPSQTLRTICFNAFASLFLALDLVAAVVLLIEDRDRLPVAAGWLFLIVFVWLGLGLFNLRSALIDIAEVMGS